MSFSNFVPIEILQICELVSFQNFRRFTRQEKEVSQTDREVMT